MLGAGNRASVRRWVADFALAFMLFWAVALALGAVNSRAWALSLPGGVPDGAITPDRAVARPARLGADRPSRAAGRPIPNTPASPEQARLLLSLAFATLAAANLGFWRHLRRVYASPRRAHRQGGRRRG